MVIDGVEYQPVNQNGRVAIVVCDRGFVLVGRITIANSYVTITSCHNVRRWGTTKGLGQIASGGPVIPDDPSKGTILDPQPTTRVHELQVVQIIDCEEGKWNL